MSLTLKRAFIDKDDRNHALYEMRHCGPVTTLDLDVEVVIDSRYEKTPITAAMDIITPSCDSVEESLDKLAEWLERSAAGIRARQKDEKTLSFSLYANLTQRVDDQHKV